MKEQRNQNFLRFLENEIQRININYYKNQSIKWKLLNYIPVIEKLIIIKNENIKEAYLTEILRDFCSIIEKISFEGLEINTIKKIKNLLNRIQNLSFIDKVCPEIKESLIKVDDWYEKLQKILTEQVSNCNNYIYIPLLENNSQIDDNVLGLLEIIIIKVNKAKYENKYIIVPSEKTLENFIEKQIKTSWYVAINYIKKFIKNLAPFHEVVIYFERRDGFCHGNSLGAALTIKYIEELLNLYNPTFIIEPSQGLAITGGMDEKGRLLPIGEKVIRKKVKLVFYSLVNQLVIPKADEATAKNELEKLKEFYPNRGLKIVAVEDLEDLLNRRNLIKIRKQNFLKRTKKYIFINKLNVFFIFSLILWVFYLLVLNIDNNPFYVSLDGMKAHIKNKYGKILLSMNYPFKDIYKINTSQAVNYFFKFVDIDNDGNNEIIYISPSKSDLTGEELIESVKCIDKNKKELWSYSFSDTIYSEREDLPPIYNVRLIDTITFKGKKIIFCFANNKPSFSSAVFGLELKNGRRIEETLWTSGHIYGAFLKDLNNNKIVDLVISGLDNGYEDAIVFGVELENMNGCRLSTNQYLIKNKQIINPIFYIRIPKCDYESMMGFRFPYVREYDIRYREVDKKIILGLFSFSSKSVISDRIMTYTLEIDTAFKVSEIIIDDDFRVLRDSLVVQKKLRLPYTDTKEYKELLKRNIIYWVNGRWIRNFEKQ